MINSIFPCDPTSLPKIPAPGPELLDRVAHVVECQVREELRKIHPLAVHGLQREEARGPELAARANDEIDVGPQRRFTW